MIFLKTDEQIEKIRKSGQLARSVLDMIAEHVKPGISTEELDQICHEYILENKAIPAPLHYKGFPKSICTSVNEVICHGIPHKKHFLKEGDILNIDVTTILDGFHGDTSRMYLVGEVKEKARHLVDTTKECLERAIAQVKVGNRIGDIGHAIQTHAEARGYSVVRDFIGHGIGENFHEEPAIPHYGRPKTGLKFKPGMVFTIEPMINEGSWGAQVLRDGWTAVTKDRKWSAQFEHTIGIRSDGQVEILTR